MAAKDECTVQKINILKIQRTRHPLNFQAKMNKNELQHYKTKKGKPVDRTSQKCGLLIERNGQSTRKGNNKKNMCFLRSERGKKGSRYS